MHLFSDKNKERDRYRWKIPVQPDEQISDDYNLSPNPMVKDKSVINFNLKWDVSTEHRNIRPMNLKGNRDNIEIDELSRYTFHETYWHR